MASNPSQNATNSSASKSPTFLGHPRGLVILFLTEMWERFSYYGMRALLIIYLTQHFLFSDEKSSLIYGAYTALVYVMTIIGGSLADRYLGARKAVTFGAILLTLGHFGMAFEGNGSSQYLTFEGQSYEIKLDGRGGDARQQILHKGEASYINFGRELITIEDDSFAEIANLPKAMPSDEVTTSVTQEDTYVFILYLSLALLIAGVGFLKANISTIVGSLYGFGDVRRDSGFTIFYMGINLGAFSASILCGYLGIAHGWKYGFGLAGFGMMIGLLIFLYGQKWLEGRAEPPDPIMLKEKVFAGLNREWLCYLAGIGIIIISLLLVMNEDIVGTLLLPIGIAMFAFFIYFAFYQCNGDERSRMLAALYFVLAQIPFWALFEQAGSSLNLFTTRLVEREIFGFSIPGPVFQSLNAGYIFIFAPLVAWLWIWLAKRNLNPSSPVKFSIGVAFAGLGFLSLVAGINSSGPEALTPVIFIFLIYWIHTMGELLVSPVGLSVVTKLAPARIVGMTMGAWFLYSGLSNYLAGVIARTTGAETIGGQIVDIAAAKAGYIAVYSKVGYTALGIALFMLIVSPLVKQAMRGAE